ncbi:bile acid:sodium symporter family protein [Egicoccus sp. AB-alg2]|uniref:bile acid:sodium symporter family protein n=1 Tax=Egicoccus sp. AB-alg2 TaxID=3242693 RepID=UPI00359DAACF
MEQNPLVEIGLPIALFVIMVGIGLTLTTGDFRREARTPRGAVVGSLAQLLVMPALGFAIAALLGLPPALAVGLVIVAACPGGTSSNLITFLARANVALSIVLTVVASVVTIVTLPLFANVALGRQPVGTDVSVSVPLGRTITLLVGIVLVPVVLGMLVRRRAPARAAALERRVSAFGAAVLVVLIAGIALSLRDRFFELLAQAGPATLLLNLAGLAVGWLAARGAGLRPADRLAVAIELGIKNSTLGILIAVNVLRSEEIAVPAAVYGLLMYLSAAVLVVVGRRAAGMRVEPATKG